MRTFLIEHSNWLWPVGIAINEFVLVLRILVCGSLHRQDAHYQAPLKFLRRVANRWPFRRVGAFGLGSRLEHWKHEKRCEQESEYVDQRNEETRHTATGELKHGETPCGRFCERR